MKNVFVGLSGGVDSSVAALLLKQQGYAVTGIYMKNWTQDLPGAPCPWEEDYNDAKRVAVQLDIDFKVYDFQKEYRQIVIDYMLDEYKSGNTPNPDIMCNQEIKFGLFFKTCIQDGADLIATGHYARNQKGRLFMARDKSKDQTYFLYRASKQALSKTLYPIGTYFKSDIRKLAASRKLVTADKDESMGLCFVGKVGVKEFLSQYVKAKQGKIINQSEKVIGEHDGAIFYTIGQRHGLNVGGGLPYYVVGKNMKKNEIYVTTDLQDSKLWSNQLHLTNIHKLSPKLEMERGLRVRTRHLGKLVPVKSIEEVNDNNWKVNLEEEVRAITPGQSAVFYSANECLGGGIVT